TGQVQLLAAHRHRSSPEGSLQPRQRAASRVDRRAGPHRAAARDRRAPAHLRRMNLKTRTMSPEDQAERLAARQAYLDAVRAWVNTGRHALPAGDARAALPKVTREIAEAHARFRLGVWLRAHGNPVEGDRQMNTASALHPDSWSMWRQSADLDEVGKASGPDFWKRVQALGDRPYYPPPKL